MSESRYVGFDSPENLQHPSASPANCVQNAMLGVFLVPYGAGMEVRLQPPPVRKQASDLCQPEKGVKVPHQDRLEVVLLSEGCTN